MKYTITISKTSDSKQEYLQVLSADPFSTNIVLIGEFKVNDARKAVERAKEKTK